MVKTGESDYGVKTALRQKTKARKTILEYGQWNNSSVHY